MNTRARLPAGIHPAAISRRPPRLAIGLLAGMAALANTTAAELTIRFTGVTTEPVEVEHRAPLTAAESRPSRGAFAVLLLTPDGTIPTEDLSNARSAAQTIANMLMAAARNKYGADVPVTHEIIVSTNGAAGPHRDRLRNAGYTYISAMPVTGTTQRIMVEGHGLKEFAPADVLGEGVAVIALSARPTITPDGSMRLNLTGRITETRVGSRRDGVDDPALQEALQRFRAETTPQIAALLMPYNFRTWNVTARDREQIVLGERPLKKAVPLTVFGQTVRLKVALDAELQFPAEPAIDALWNLVL